MRQTSRNPRPFFTWPGGKQRVLGELGKHLPAKFGSYHEPFVGGGAMFFSVCSAEPRHATLYDANTAVIRAYRGVVSDPKGVSEAFARHRAVNSKAHFDDVKRVFCDCGDVEMAARLMYVTKAAYSGQYRENGKGRPSHGYDPRAKLTLKPGRLDAVAAALQGVRLVNDDFPAVLSQAGRDDLAFLDPPYVGSRDDYDRTGFTLRDHRRLRDVCRELDARGVMVMQVNADHELVRELYRGMRMVPFTYRRRNGGHNGAQDATDVLIRNY